MRSRSPPVAYERVRSPPIELRRGASPGRYSIRSLSPLRERVVIAERPLRSYGAHPIEKDIYEAPITSSTKPYESSSSRYASLPSSREIIIDGSSSYHREYKPIETSRSYPPSPLPERRPIYSSQPEAYGGGEYIPSSRESSSSGASKVIVYDYKPPTPRSSSYYNTVATEPDRYRTEVYSSRGYEYR